MSLADVEAVDDVLLKSLSLLARKELQILLDQFAARGKDN